MTLTRSRWRGDRVHRPIERGQRVVAEEEAEARVVARSRAPRRGPGTGRARAPRAGPSPRRSRGRRSRAGAGPASRGRAGASRSRRPRRRPPRGGWRPIARWAAPPRTGGRRRPPSPPTRCQKSRLNRQITLSRTGVHVSRATPPAGPSSTAVRGAAERPSERLAEGGGLDAAEVHGELGEGEGPAGPVGRAPDEDRLAEVRLVLDPVEVDPQARHQSRLDGPVGDQAEQRPDDVRGPLGEDGLLRAARRDVIDVEDHRTSSVENPGRTVKVGPEDG